MAALKFKSYVPPPGKPRKPKQIGSGLRKYCEADPEPQYDGEAAQYVVEGYLGMNNQADMMTLDMTHFNVCDDMESVGQFGETCTASTLCRNEGLGHLGTLSNQKHQLSIDEPKTNPGNIHNQGSIRQAKDQLHKGADRTASMIANQALIAAAVDPVVNEANDATLAAVHQAKASTAMQLSDIAGCGTSQRRRSVASISPALSISPPPKDAGSPSPESLFNDDAGFQRWLDAELQDSAPNSKRSSRLPDSGYDSSSDDPRPTKRQKLSSTVERGTLLREPDVCESVLAPVDDMLPAHGVVRRASSTRLLEGNPISPSASTRSDAAAFSPRRPPVKMANREDARTNPSHMINTLQPPPLMGLPAAVRFRQRQETEQSGECNSCAIFRAALVEALSLLQNPSYQVISNITRNAQPRSNLSKRRYSLRKRPTPPENDCEDSDDNPVGYIDKHCNGTDYSDILSSDDNEDNWLGKTAKSTNISAKRRRWSELEERRLRAWKRENKSESWIASKLDRTTSAVKQQWVKMNKE